MYRHPTLIAIFGIVGSALAFAAGVITPSPNYLQAHADDDLSYLWPPALREDGRLTTEGALRTLSDEVPGFGGLFLNSDGRLQVYVKDIDKDSKATLVALQTIANDFREFDANRIDIRQGQYSYMELQRWQDRATNWVLPLKGVSYTDNQEATNRVEIGVYSGDVIASVEGRLRDLQVPREAVDIRVVGAPQLLDLDDRYRYPTPLAGGLQIQSQSAGGQTQGTCSLGFVAYFPGKGAGVVTASHCTPFIHSLDGSTLHQPTVNGSINYIGLETVDPPPFTGGPCPSGNPAEICQFGDVVWFKFDGAYSLRGYIARSPLHSSPGNFQEWNGVDRFNIVGYVGGGPVGKPVQKVGWASGRTTGSVTGTNVNKRAPSGVLMLWQDHAYFEYPGTTGGDSGSPVFEIWNAATNDVLLNGVVWYKEGVTTYFSDINWIQFPQTFGDIYFCKISSC